MSKRDPEKMKASRAAWRATHKAESNAISRAYYAAHAEKLLAERAADRAANPAKYKARAAAYNSTHREQMKAAHAAWYAAYREERNARNAAWRAAHQEERKAYRAAYVKAHLQAYQVVNARRRAHKRQAPINDFTAQQWRDMQAAYDHRCIYCKKRFKGKLTQDHLTPLSKGGSHTLVNIVPACRSCNSKKRAGPVLKPVQPLLLAMAPEEKKR